jgi:2-amino-4-hydroxy-6-hydroxymethyldihydropteridine diphosphokinase/dihydropteroate synthase
MEVHKKRRAYIALGSNLGDRIGWIEKACDEMSARDIKVMRTSSLWETEPMYVLDQDNFVNGACEVGLVSFLLSFSLQIHIRSSSSRDDAV